MRLRSLRRLQDPLVGRVEDAERDVLADRGREEEGILGDDSDLTPERAARHVPDVDAVDEHAALGRVVEARHERRECRLSRPCVADQGDRSSRGDLELDLVQHRPPLGVAEADALEVDRTRADGELDRVGAVVDALRLVHHLEDPLARSRRALGLTDPHAKASQGDDQHREQQVEDEEAAERERAAHDHPAGGQQHRALREQRQEREQRHVDRSLPERADGCLEDCSRGALELRLAPVLLGEGLDHVDADDRLLGHRRDVSELLLHVAENGVRDVAVPVRDGDDHRRDRERDQGEPPLDEEQHGHHGDDRQHVLEEEDEAEAEEEAHRLQVDGRA